MGEPQHIIAVSSNVASASNVASEAHCRRNDYNSLSIPASSLTVIVTNIIARHEVSPGLTVAIAVIMAMLYRPHHQGVMKMWFNCLRVQKSMRREAMLTQPYDLNSSMDLGRSLHGSVTFELFPVSSAPGPAASPVSEVYKTVPCGPIWTDFEPGEPLQSVTPSRKSENHTFTYTNYTHSCCKNLKKIYLILLDVLNVLVPPPCP